MGGNHLHISSCQSGVCSTANSLILKFSPVWKLLRQVSTAQWADLPTLFFPFSCLFPSHLCALCSLDNRTSVFILYMHDFMELHKTQEPQIREKIRYLLFWDWLSWVITTSIHRLLFSCKWHNLVLYGYKESHYVYEPHFLHPFLCFRAYWLVVFTEDFKWNVTHVIWSRSRTAQGKWLLSTERSRWS